MTERKPMLIFVNKDIKDKFFDKSRGLGLIPSRVAWTLIEMFTFDMLDQTKIYLEYKRINNKVRVNQTNRLLSNRFTPKKNHETLREDLP